MNGVTPPTRGGAIACADERPSRRGNLILTRRIGERVVIGDSAGSIDVEVIEVRGRAARLSIRAPLGMAISRRDVGEF